MKNRATRLSAIRKHLITFAVAAISVIVTASVLGLGPPTGDGSGNKAFAAISNCPSPTVSNSPCIKYGFKDGPVVLDGNLTTIASLPVGPGKYVINAKLYIQNYRYYSNLSLPASCQLVAGPNFDWAKESIPSTNTNGISQDLTATMSFTVANTFTSAGSIDLKCKDDRPIDVPTLSANFIKITAQKVGTLIRLNM
jgi:hypothetical protein